MRKALHFIKKLLKIVIYTYVGVFSLFTAFFAMFLVIIAMAAGASMSTGSSLGTEELEMELLAGDNFAKDKLVSIPIKGLILGERDESSAFLEMFSDSGVTYGYSVKDQLIKLAEKTDVKGVILDIDSPGGTIFGAKAITDGVEYYKKQTGKPVVAFVGGLAASGSYWAAASADEIYADAGTMIGSIGVIAGPFKYYDGVIEEDDGIFGSGVTTTNGIQTEYISSGRSKDIGNPYRPLTDEERAVLQKGSDNAYEQFVSFVAKQRQLDQSTIKDKLGALIYDELEAKNLRLIDDLANRDDSYKHLADKAGTDDYAVYRVNKSKNLLSSLASVLALPKLNSASTSRLPAFCNSRMSVLVYSGDISSLCK